MEITELRRTKRGRISLYLEGEFACVLHPDVWALSSLTVGGQLTPEQLQELDEASQRRLCSERALSLLSGRSYTSAALYDKLREKVESEAVCAATVARMVELGLVDDLDYARRYAKDCINRKGYSPQRTGQALRQKGLDRHLVDEVLQELEADPEPAIARVIARKYARYLDDEKGILKTMAALQRLGYRYGDIRTVLSHLAEDPDWYTDTETAHDLEE